MAEAEEVLGRPLPGLLRRLYLEVGNGGFGPGYGLLGLSRGHTDDLRWTALHHLARGRDQGWERLFPLCHWGCAIYSLVDCRDGSALMWGYDPNPVPEGVAVPVFPQGLTFTEWLERWLAGTLEQPAAVQDPITGEWRGATDEEYAAWAAELDEWFPAAEY